MKSRRWLLILIPLVIVFLVVATLPVMQTAKWIGRMTVDVLVFVIDTDAMEPVPDAQVMIFQGARTPLEGSISWRKQSDFVPDATSADTE